jgi:two-component system response regulator CpxR
MVQEKRILIADDDKMFVSFVQDALAGRGLSIEATFDGESTLSRALSGGFDLILLDVMMPKIDGYHISSELMRAMGERPRSSS